MNEVIGGMRSAYAMMSWGSDYFSSSQASLLLVSATIPDALDRNRHYFWNLGCATDTYDLVSLSVLNTSDSG